jgi:hypothetical protein
VSRAVLEKVSFLDRLRNSHAMIDVAGVQQNRFEFVPAPVCYYHGPEKRDTFFHGLEIQRCNAQPSLLRLISPAS